VREFNTSTLGVKVVRQTSFAEMQCSLARSLEKIGDWWTPLILRDLQLGVDKFDALADDLGISRNLLAARLSHLVDNGIIMRSQYSEHPPRYRYLLTESGKDLMPILGALTAWGDKWATPEGGPPLVFRHLTCGQISIPTVSCGACGQPVKAGEIATLPGPGARKRPGTQLLNDLLSADPAQP
jgi:DNA-binding HxlR family transcriptional regulator